MKNGLVVIAFLVLAVAVVVGGCAQDGSPPASGGNGTAYVVVMTDGQFTPDVLVIKAGDTVSFLNNDSVHTHWPASAAHPMHTVYPEPGGCIGSKFDACKELAYGERFNFTFNARSTTDGWSYHDHLNPVMRGKIVVE